MGILLATHKRFQLHRPLLSIILLGLLSACCSVDSQQETVNRREAAQARMRLALAYLAQGELPRARYNLEKALQYQPKSASVLASMAYYQQQVGEPGIARVYYERALRRAPQDGQLLHQYADFLCQQRCYSDAQRYFNTALQTPGYSQVGETLQHSGYCYLLAGDSAAAQSRLQRALQHHPDQGKEWIRWGHRAIDQGRIQAAKAMLSLHLVLLPDTPESISLRQRLLNHPQIDR